MKSKSLAKCPECRHTLAKFECSGAKGFSPKGGCREPKHIRIKRGLENRAKQRQDPTYQKEAAHLTRERLHYLEQRDLVHKINGRLVKERARAILSSHTPAQDDQDLVKGPPPRATWTVEHWRRIPAWANKKDAATGTLRYPTLRARALEWLRMETLLLAEQHGLFTPARLVVFLSARRMQNDERAVYLKQLLNESDSAKREDNWRLFCSEHAADLALAAKGAHHRLLTAKSPDEPTAPYYSWGYAVTKRSRPHAIKELRTTRLRTITPGQPGDCEWTVILPAADDVVMDETAPGIARIAPNRRFYSVDFDAPGGAQELKKQLERIVMEFLNEQQKQRGPGGGKRRDLARMWEALQLYRDSMQSRGRKELHRIGKKALAFGPPPTAAADQKRIAFYERRGQAITDLAEEMIQTALFPSQNAAWTRTFL